MAYESLDDVVEQIADWCGVYGTCRCEDAGTECCKSRDPTRCRLAFVIELKSRILEAVRVDAALAGKEPLS